ncbi:phosphate ABC transporter substrate-binding protein PstS [Varunaivibrio sulfuroxidans]|uniref:Phosphate-binding protein PstS n=1 Tax=Varunaivibrio sulfuroxidans TaxID=1773489 RepID=A0A4R3J9T2_9PROT|nr:phosphate ABC transporter substrate-binding protein PstS [Varunaivibrio sulfuroxidans]TCS61723.1 phosphate ABC transporter substrate-binding protein (PhoT family) [Varunaivibrio sulfuroxidans]WES32092.1 phosphate ABC transporter substrate-binding protein PstS [Varunaivibrio sulfuroxidans]
MNLLNSNFVRAAAVVVGVAASATIAHAGQISGAGATFPYPIYAKWAQAYQAKTGMGLNYQSIGSGGGIKQIQAKTVTFGASDKPLKSDVLDKYGLAQFPMIMGGIVPIVNVEGIKPGELVIDGETLANIFLGKISKWNDPEIAAINPGVNLPSKSIAVVHRSDGSGTTFNFTNYLNKVSSSWKSTVGSDTSVQWPVGIGAKGNEGVANMVKQTGDSIGYVEYAYAKQNALSYTKMKNKEGHVVAPTSDAFQAAAANADWAHAPGYRLILTDQPGAGSWPITAASFILMYKKPVDDKASSEALKFFEWAYHNGGDAAASLDYIPMPMSVVKMVEDTWQKDIKDSHGKALAFR